MLGSHIEISDLFVRNGAKVYNVKVQGNGEKFALRKMSIENGHDHFLVS